LTKYDSYEYCVPDYPVNELVFPTMNEEDAIQEVGKDGQGKKRTYPINCDPSAIAILSLK